MALKIDSNFLKYKSALLRIIENFNSEGILFADGKRNKIRLFNLDGLMINIKSFKKPHLINKIVYKYFRKSKARRSYEYGIILLEKGIGTPRPIAFFENFSWLGLKDSYYASEHIETELTFRELINIPDYPDHSTILRQFTKFTFDLHERGVEFQDHSPGNTLIERTSNGNFNFLLVDLNRMKFHDSMDFNKRMNNFSRLTTKAEMIAVMSDEYAKLYDKSYDEVYSKMSLYAKDFDFRLYRRIARKKKLLFWK